MTRNRILSREQLREIDRSAEVDLGLSTLVLMENAGRGCADLLLQQGLPSDAPVCICCGRGNNGGDGFVMARHLDEAGVPVQVLIFGSPASGSPGAVNLEILRKAGIPVRQLELPRGVDALREHLQRSSWVVDALLGTGTTPPLRSPYDLIVKEINDSRMPVLAIDLPSGMDCDTGETGGGCIRATLTASLVAMKPGFKVPTAQEFLGRVHILSIGIPQCLLTSAADSEEFGMHTPTPAG